ncbi:MAG: D-tyrosyl-tRNA(Tyr) deacylase [Firmicutes bacterium]|nr:D-tyrosyl-tRNA(Tyr) deacylase [Bacillota bacterium]
MRAIIQRVSQANVTIEDQVYGEISQGLVVLLGVGQEDDLKDCQYMAEKIPNLRIFQDEQDKMNLSLQQVGGEILLISQFTLYGDARKGRRPGFSSAAEPKIGEELYDKTLELLRQQGIKVATGRFGANMQIGLINDGPVTIMLDSKKLF